MIRCVRIWTADDGNSRLEEGQIALPHGQRGDILLAEDTAGSGHRWKLVGEEPWRRAYVILVPEVEVPLLQTSAPV